MTEHQQEKVIAMLPTRRANAGFSLLQVTIVLMIIGLLAGIVVYGADMVRNATVRKQITQLELIEGGIQNFRTKYSCYAGDCADPTVISGYTYSGNGNGFLESNWNNDENKGFWIHLTQSGMIADILTNHAALAGMRVPRTIINPATGIINAYGSMSYAQNILEFSTATAGAGFIRTVDIMNIDSKVDDGRASTGSILASGTYTSPGNSIFTADPTFPVSPANKNGTNYCTDGTNYSVAVANNECNMVYISGIN